MKTAWDLSLLYKDLKDPRIERDQKDADKKIAAFAAKYRKNKLHLKNPLVLAKALTDYEQLIGLPAAKAGFYTSFRKELDVEDKAAEALAAKLDERGAKRGNLVVYFTLELGKVPAPVQKKFLAYPSLAPYRYWKKQLFENAMHDLTEPEEKILNLFGDVAHGRWIQATENALNKKTVAYAGRTLPLP